LRQRLLAAGSPACWLSLTLLFIVLTLLPNLLSWSVALIFATLLILWGWLFGLPGRTLYRLLPLVSVGLLALLVILLSQPAALGTPALWLGVPEVYWLANILLKSALVVLLMSGPATYFTQRQWLEAFQGLYLPGGLVALLYLMLRNLSHLREEAGRLLRARDARGGGGGGYRGLVTAAGMSQTWLTRLGLRADTQALALCARNFHGALPDLGGRRLRLAEGLLILLLGGGLAWALQLWP
jgi:energy-coupling factor transporter transmembrane protein EcfT